VKAPRLDGPGEGQTLGIWLRITTAGGEQVPARGPGGLEEESLRLTLDLLGRRPPRHRGEVSSALAARNVSIEELSTDVRDAPMAGGTLFEAVAVLSAPADASTEELRSMLEGLADELMVDITLSDN
jgi:hypothetical protein